MLLTESLYKIVRTSYKFKGTRFFFHIIFAQTAHNICLIHITPSILIYANVLGYVLSIRVEFGIQNMMSICLCCCIWKWDLKSTSRKLKKTNKTVYMNIISFESAYTLARLPFFLKLAHYLEIKSKNTSTIERDFDQHYTLPSSLLTTDQYPYVYINKEPAVKAINRKGTFV